MQVDKELASGEYFLTKEQKYARKRKEQTERHIEAAKKREERRNKPFVPPEETSYVSAGPSTSSTVDVQELKEKIKKAQKGKKKKD